MSGRGPYHDGPPPGWWITAVVLIVFVVNVAIFIQTGGHA